MFRSCGDCTACCTWLKGNSYGYEFGNGTSCKFLCGDGCSIHKIRPETCRSYQCAWSQKLFDYEMRPDKCGILASVETHMNNQYLKLVIIKDHINSDILEYFNNWSVKMNTPIVYVNKNYTKLS